MQLFKIKKKKNLLIEINTPIDFFSILLFLWMVAKLYPMSFEILIFIPLLLIRYHLQFAVHVDLN